MRMLRRGDSGAAVAEVNSILRDRKLLDTSEATADQGYFGGATERALRAFQQDRGLDPDGMVGPATFRALRGAMFHLGSRPLTYIFSEPAFGDDVLALQEKLTALGYDVGRCDAELGPLTHSALRRFQHDVGLVPDGVCGAETVHALDRLHRAPATGGSPVLLRETERLRRSGPRLHGKRIVIDPGHGGEDSGVIHDGVTESALMWDLARRLEGHMIAVGIEALLSRGPASGPAAGRAELANEADADLLLSLHVDGSASPRAQGVACFYFGTGNGRHSTVGELLAGLVQREIVARTGLADCGTHPKTWDVLTRSRCPSLRLEIGYLTNDGDRGLLLDPAFRDLVAEGILVAVKRLYLLDEEFQPMTGTYSIHDVLRHESA